MRSSISSWFSCAVLGAVLLAGCEAGKDRFIADGRKAAVAGKYEEARKNFDEALKLDGDDYNALWGKADVFQREGNLGEQQKLLEKLNADAYKEYGGVIKPALEDNYRKQAEAIMGGNPDAAEALLRKAIEINKKSDAHQTLAEILERKGDEALKKAEYATAAAAFDAAQQLRISKKMRSQLGGKGEIATFLAFKQTYMPKFDQMKGEPNEQGVYVITDRAVYDSKEKSFVVEALHVIGRQEPKTDEEKALAQKAALYEVTQALADLSWKVAGQARPEGAMVSYSRDVVEVVEQGIDKDGRDFFYGLRVKLPEDAVIEQVQVIEKGEFKTAAAVQAERAAADAAAAAGAAGAEGGAAPAAPEGGAAPGAPEGGAAPAAPEGAAPAAPEGAAPAAPEGAAPAAPAGQ